MKSIIRNLHCDYCYWDAMWSCVDAMSLGESSTANDLTYKALVQTLMYNKLLLTEEINLPLRNC